MRKNKYKLRGMKDYGNKIKEYSSMQINIFYNIAQQASSRVSWGYQIILIVTWQSYL